MRQNITGLLSTLLVIFILFNLALILRIVRGSIEEESNAITQTELESALIAILYKQMETENTRLDGSILLEDEYGQKLSLKDLVIDRPLVILHYSELHCNLCIDYSLEYCKRLADSVGNENIAIIAEYKNSSDLILFKRINQLSIDVYRLNGEGLGLPIEKYMVPYLFITDHTLIAKHVHVPDKDISILHNVFVSTIPKQYRKIRESELSRTDGK